MRSIQAFYPNVGTVRGLRKWICVHFLMKYELKQEKVQSELTVGSVWKKCAFKQSTEMTGIPHYVSLFMSQNHFHIWPLCISSLPKSPQSETHCWNELLRPASWMNPVHAGWNENQMSEYSACPLLCIRFIWLVSPGPIISWIRSSNSERPGSGTMGRLFRSAHRECACGFDGAFPHWVRRGGLFFSPITTTFGFRHLHPLELSQKRGCVFVSEARALLQHVPHCKAMPRMLSLHLETDSLSGVTTLEVGSVVTIS